MKPILILFTFLFTITTMAQSYAGYISDNYNGIHGVMANPANIADARVKFDFNLISVGALAANDYVNFSLDNITQLANGLDFNGLNTFPSNQNEILVDVDIMGPSFMLNLNEKHSVGIITRVRMMNNYNNINGELFESVLDGFPMNNFDFEQTNLDGTSHLWGEVGVSYGRVLFNDYDRHYLKAGVTAKYLMGAGFAQGSSQSISGNFNATNNQVNLNGDFLYASNFNEDQEITDYLQNTSSGIGGDIGLVYEYRTRNSSLGAANDNPRALNKYKVKVGVSLLDLGQISYKNQQLERYAINGSINADDLEDDFSGALENNFSKLSPEGNITIALPTTLKLTIDYQVMRNIYANLDITQSMVQKNDLFNNNRLNIISFTPRFETRNISAYLPISYSVLGQTAIGAGVKLGPVILGSASILSNLILEDTAMADVYVAFKIPINYKR